MNVGIDASRIALEQRTGTENYTYNLIEAIKKIDQQNKYTLYFNKLPSYFEITQTNISTRYIPMPRFWTQARLLSEVFIKPPDLLFIPAHTLPILRRAKLKTVVTVHDLGAEYLPEYHRFPQKLYLNWSTKFAAAFSDALIAVSESTKKDLIKRFRTDPKKITVIHEGIDTEFFYPREKPEVEKVRATLGLSKPYLLFVGTVQPRKNLEFLIESFSKLKNKEIDLVVAGKPGWLYEEIYTSPKKFEVGDRVKFIGFVEGEDLPALYSGATAFVFPSLYEGFGLPLLEAMACGCPVIAADNSSMPEVVGEAGVLVKTSDQKAWVKALNEVITNEKLRSELVRKGKTQARKFTWERTALETIKLFEKVYQS
ncbi:MAG TPA: glycosyltransferase family 1 protein [Candidatus Saccharimonadales bacterium]|nr:glycosyltransferase family 1 protein [Candidatus Saccharimonadales bacterium]